MARHPNPNNKFTTISIRKEDKRTLRRIALQEKETKNGIVYQKDADVLSIVLRGFIQENPGMLGDVHPTYPASVQDNNQDKSQPNSSRVAATLS